MKQRLLSLLVFLTLMFSLTLPARADVLWTPDNTFFEAHESECTYVGRSYYANGQDGYITVWNVPDGGIVVGQLENAVSIHVYWLYQGWGCVSILSGSRWVDGWVAMSDLLLIYDHVSFAEEYADEIRAYNNEFATYDGDSVGIVFWEYPNAPTPNMIWGDHTDITSQLVGEETPSYISKIYVDEDGRTWGYIGYLYGHMESWFCLDDPKGETLLTSDDTSTTDADDDGTLLRPLVDPNAVVYPPATPRLPAVSYLPWFLVGSVVLLTVLLLVFFYRQRKKQV